MGLSVLPYRYRLNGVLDTNDTVFNNIEKIANSAASWVSFDALTGKWDVVINKEEAISYVFDDTNIIGGITLQSTDLKDIKNIVEVKFPHSDLNGQLDYIKIKIPEVDKLPNEPDNILSIEYRLLNDPVQAQLLGLIELKQSRMDKIITFRTDFRALDLPAGAVISVTNSLYGFISKTFRIVTISEVSTDGGLMFEIVALEYSASVYDTSDLYRYIRTNSTGILSIGSIGVPDAPQVTKFEVSSRPEILIEAITPGGIVNAVEFWLTLDVPPGVGDDANRSYRLIGTQYAPTGSTYAIGTTVPLRYDSLGTSNFLIKVRGRNGDVTGPFSLPSGLIEYAPTQVTDAIGQNTGIRDAAGSPITGLLTANALMALLGQLFNGSSGGTGTGYGGLGSIFSKIFEVYETKNGTNINTPAAADAIGALAAANGKISVIATAGSITTASISPGEGIMHSLTFIPDVSGTYKIDCILDQNGSGARGGRGSAFGEVEDSVAAAFNLKQGASIICSSGSGGVGAFYWTDFVVTGIVPLTAGITYTLEFVYWVSTESDPSALFNFDISWNVYTIAVL